MLDAVVVVAEADNVPLCVHGEPEHHASLGGLLSKAAGLALPGAVVLPHAAAVLECHYG